jgi:hypothetical protein
VNWSGGGETVCGIGNGADQESGCVEAEEVAVEEVEVENVVEEPKEDELEG